MGVKKVSIQRKIIESLYFLIFRKSTVIKYAFVNNYFMKIFYPQYATQ